VEIVLGDGGDMAGVSVLPWVAISVGMKIEEIMRMK
jgi:hypothetical protein